MTQATRIAVVGAGIFGVTAAIALQRRGAAVSLFDPGPLPHPLAESTDISKVVRMDYGGDDAYMSLMERALEGWRRWNAEWPEPLFHETGVTFLTRSPMVPGGFERESYARLVARGHRPERLDAAAIKARFPAWKTGAFVDGYFNRIGGFAESGRVVERLLQVASAAGVELLPRQTFAGLLSRGSRVVGLGTLEGGNFAADKVIIAAGAWTPHILPFMAEHLRSVGQPVFHLKPSNPDEFKASCFPVFGADISQTGYYGFPLSRDGVVKIANHGTGRRIHPESSERAVTADEESRLRAFLRDTFPSLEGAPIVYTRVCVYCDTWDEHFWIAPDPDREGLIVAAGGSGHAFKFAPIIGDIIADAALGAPNPALARFRHRPEVRPARGEEEARFHG